MWLTFTWIRFLIVLCKVQLGYNADDFVTVTMTHSPTVPVQLCEQFNFTCRLSESNTQLDPHGTHSLVVYLQNYDKLLVQKNCTMNKKLTNKEWGAAVYTILLMDNLTYKKTSQIGGDKDEINAGIIHMSHKDRDFTFTIDTVRKPPGDNFLCFTCQLEAAIAGGRSAYKVNHKTVELKVNKKGDDKTCQIKPDQCHLRSSQRNEGFSYQRNISSTECANCTCQKTSRKQQNTSLFKCDMTPCPTLHPPTTTVMITTTILENTTAAAPTTKTPKEPDYTMYYILVGLVVGVALVLGGSYFLYKTFIASTNTDSSETSSSIPIKYSSRRQSGISRASRQSGTSRASRQSGFPRASRQSRFSRASRQSEFSRQSPQPQPTTYVVKQVQQRLVY